jgi:hypothetical protein
MILLWLVGALRTHPTPGRPCYHPKKAHRIAARYHGHNYVAVQPEQQYRTSFLFDPLVSSYASPRHRLHSTIVHPANADSTSSLDLTLVGVGEEERHPHTSFSSALGMLPPTNTLQDGKARDTLQ